MLTTALVFHRFPTTCFVFQAGHDDGSGEPLVSPARTFSPIAAGKRMLKPSSPRKIPRRPVTNVS